MKLEVYGEGQDSEVPVRLRLIQEGNNVKLIAVDEDGDALYSGYLFTITADGYLVRCTHVNPSLGFKLEDADKIKIKE